MERDVPEGPVARKGRPKVQFASDQAGEEFWRLYEQIARLHHQDAQRKAAELAAANPGLHIAAPTQPMPAGRLVLRLMAEELERLNSAQKTRD
jgi:hypothetical protein